ncbi:MAG: GIN domain-containing protein [Bacteroidota bacterium]
MTDRESLLSLFFKNPLHDFLMHRSGRWLLTAALVLIAQSCDKDHLFDCTKSTGKIVTENRPLKGFTKLYLSDNVDVVLKKGTTYEVKVTAGLQLIDGIITELQGNKLYIRNENRCNWIRNFNNSYTVELTFPVELESIYYDGAGSITCMDSLRRDGFAFECWNGSGDIHLLLSTAASNLKIHLGRCLLDAQGYSSDSYIYLNDVGVVDASRLISSKTYVKSGSTGDATVNAHDELQVEIEHTGNVYYVGNPSTITRSITGSGRLLPR